PLKKIIAGIRPLLFLLTFTMIIQLFTISEGNKIFSSDLTMHFSVTSILAIIAIIVIYNITKKSLPFRTLYFYVVVFLIFYVQFLLPFGKLTSYSFNPTDVSIIRGIFLFVRIVVTVLFTSLLTFTTMTTDLNYGFEVLMKPLKIFRFPVEVVAMMLSLILRFIPTLLFETEKIMKAQASRGLDFKESKLREKLTQVIALLVPIFLISINRAEELSDAMETRGYVIGQKRTRIDEYRLVLKDYLAFLFVVLLLGIVIYFKVAY
ncbi:MAG: energy-coupling factor transporter transmembrane component T, partial [Acholeplasma sp.]|nr:energy-coupling factor transporter transmembrane component T [Acholeplasma sp.]